MSGRKTSIKVVKSFPQLVKYLRDELGWPLDHDDYEDIVWDYKPEELGLKPNEAAGVEYIRQLRPLTDSQPFGIFFVKFKKGRLPVVAMRRILSSLVVKKRASAQTNNRPTWQMNDLLFLSSWGEKDQRQMNFAHFADNPDRKDLPTLRVLDWGKHRTGLAIKDVEQKLHDHLIWPEDDSDKQAWRKQWRDAFTVGHRETIDTSKALSIRLAELARAIRDRISDALAIETDKGPLTTLLKAFQQGLVHDLDEGGFADMYAQTIAYGLLSARIADPKKKTVDDFAAHMRTSPFLRELMETFLAVGGRKGKAGGPGIDFDELGVSEVVELLDDTETNMEAVVRDFGDRNRQEDPVIHFYELFLHEYNKQLKIQRGVFYTPQPVVSYIVRSVHELLQTEFGLVDGLADTTTWGEMLKKHKDLQLPPLTDEPGEKRTISPDEPFVQILDPATGTATFLVEVIDVIYNTMTAKWKQQGKKAKTIDALWNDYVPQHLLPRLHAYELMMAPYAIAHMKVGLKLAETGYRFETEERARIYLTNALEPWQKQLKLPDFAALAHEAAAVNEIKRHKGFTVVIGNPPYAGLSANLTTDARAIVERYKFIDGERIREKGALQFEKNLQDDYVKFFAWSEKTATRGGLGILAFISNHGFLETPTLRGMRWQLLDSFSDLYLFDMHGSTKRPIDSDENVFDIQQGVSISLFAKSLAKDHQPKVHRADLLGARAYKYNYLEKQSAQTTEWTAINPSPPFFQFLALDNILQAEYLKYTSITDVMPFYSSGTETGFDLLMVDFTRDELLSKLERFLDPHMTCAEVAAEFSIGQGTGKKLLTIRDEFRKDFEANGTKRCVSGMYRVFDNRTYYYKKEYLKTNSLNVMRNLLDTNNMALVAFRQQSQEGFQHVFITKKLGDKNAVSLRTREINYYFPLRILPDDDTLQLETKPSLNFGRTFLTKLATGLDTTTNKENGLPINLAPEDIFHYIYAVFHSPGYRERYAEFLKIDFPRLPLTGNLELFRALVRLGTTLTALHLLESTRLNNPVTEFIGDNPQVAKVGWTPDDGGTVWLDGKGTTKNFQPGTSGFRPVPEEVWNFHIGGYQVCEKWLKDRGPKKGKPGRTLSEEDITHYHKIVLALTETIRTMAEIDEVIEQHGGWPDAFATQTAGPPKVAEDAAGYEA